jgi:hypothetical protein
MDNEFKVPWYKPGPKFEISDAVKDFFILIVVTFIAGGLNAVIALFEGSSHLVPPQFLAYTGLLIAVLHTLYTIIINYKNGL